jgi:transposase-like protein
MPKGKPVVSADVKQQILKRMKEDGVPVLQLAQEHGISDKTIYGWVSKGLTGQVSLMQMGKLKRENRALREMLGKVLFEAAMAKKKHWPLA